MTYGSLLEVTSLFFALFFLYDWWESLSVKWVIYVSVKFFFLLRSWYSSWFLIQGSVVPWGSMRGSQGVLLLATIVAYWYPPNSSILLLATIEVDEHLMMLLVLALNTTTVDCSSFWRNPFIYLNIMTCLSPGLLSSSNARFKLPIATFIYSSLSLTSFSLCSLGSNWWCPGTLLHTLPMLGIGWYCTLHCSCTVYLLAGPWYASGNGHSVPECLPSLYCHWHEMEHHRLIKWGGFHHLSCSHAPGQRSSSRNKWMSTWSAFSTIYCNVKRMHVFSQYINTQLPFSIQPQYYCTIRTRLEREDTNQHF